MSGKRLERLCEKLIADFIETSNCDQVIRSDRVSIGEECRFHFYEARGGVKRCKVGGIQRIWNVQYQQVGIRFFELSQKLVVLRKKEFRFRKQAGITLNGGLQRFMIDQLNNYQSWRLLHCVFDLGKKRLPPLSNREHAPYQVHGCLFCIATVDERLPRTHFLCITKRELWYRKICDPVWWKLVKHGGLQRSGDAHWKGSKTGKVSNAWRLYQSLGEVHRHLPCHQGRKAPGLCFSAQGKVAHACRKSFTQDHHAGGVQIAAIHSAHTARRQISRRLNIQVDRGRNSAIRSIDGANLRRSSGLKGSSCALRNVSPISSVSAILRSARHRGR